MDINHKYIKIIQEIIGKSKSDKYIVLGSAATLSFTSKIKYTRKMNDLDIIVNKIEAEKIKRILINLGFIQSTFIDKRMPFYGNLIKYKDSAYLRFSKGGVNVEMLSTKFKKKDNFLTFDLYPNIWISVPTKVLTISALNSARFTTLDVNLLWAIKQFLNNTLGRIMFYKKNQRLEDLSNLRKLADIKKAKSLLSECKLGYKNFMLRIPPFLIN